MWSEKNRIETCCWYFKIREMTWKNKMTKLVKRKLVHILPIFLPFALTFSPFLLQETSSSVSIIALFSVRHLECCIDKRYSSIVCYFLFLSIYRIRNSFLLVPMITLFFSSFVLCIYVLFTFSFVFCCCEFSNQFFM